MAGAGPLRAAGAQRLALDDRHVIYEDVNIGLQRTRSAGCLRRSMARPGIAEIAGRARRSLADPGLPANGGIYPTDVHHLNLGMFGIRHFTAIINPPQGAILAVGEIYMAPQTAGERIVAGAEMQLSLVVDHRILDGADAARFLARLRELLQDPGWMAGG
jgi:pyruvate dehydrogenase E2 component (dihydrolipoamide acetyltransferase)